MAKKIILALATAVAVVGGVAAMSAYEAHVINVTAHIENALKVDTNHIGFGTVFPQEYLAKPFTVSLSDSFKAENRVDDVQYNIVQKPKPKNPDEWQYCLTNPTDYTKCYQDLCAYLSVTSPDNNDISRPSYYTPQGCSTPGAASGQLAKNLGDYDDTWTVDLKVPPVKGTVGQDWPAGCPTVDQDSQYYGCDLWVEVTGISIPKFTNGGFETGDFTGWAVTLPAGGDAQVVTTWTGDQGKVYGSKDGSKFAIVKTDGSGSYSTVTQTVNLSAGMKVEGWAAFDSRDYQGFNDNASVKIYQGATLIATPWYAQVDGNPDYWDGPWTNWSWTALIDGDYTVELKIANVGDSVLDSYGLFDAHVVKE